MQNILICQLKQVIYGLKQALKVWYLVICNFLKEKSFRAIDSDQSIFISTNKHLFLAIYIDNLFLVRANKVQLDNLKQILCSHFWITDLGDVFHYLEIEICCNQEKGILMCLQTAYLKVVLEWFGISDYNLISTSMDNGVSNTIMQSFPNYQALANTILWYVSALGSLMYVMTMTQFNIVFASSIVSRYCNNLDFTHIAALMRILRCIKNILHNGIIFCGKLNTE